MVLSKEEQERIRKRWESHNGVSSVSPPNDVSAAEESGGTETETGTETSVVNDSDKQRIRNRWSQRFGVDESYINAFLTDADKFLTQAQSDYNKLDWSSATAESSLNYYKAMEQTENRLSDRAQNIQNFLNARKSDMDEETYNNLSSYLKNFTSPQFSKLFFDARDYYSQWESAEAYDTAVRVHGYQTKYEGKSYSDIKNILGNMEDGEEKQWLTNLAIETGDQELAAIKHKIAVEIPKQVQEWMDKFRSTSDPALKKQYFDQAKALGEKMLDLEQEYKKVDEYLSKLKNEPTWFQNNHLFDDGWQFGDVTKTVLGSGADLLENIGSGIVGIGEKLLDAALTVAPYFAQGQYYANGGGYNLQADRAFDAYIDAGKKGNAEIVKKDLYDENAIAKAIISDPLKSFTGIDAEMDSVFGEKTDSLAQSGGQLLAQIGANVVAPGSGMALMAATSLGGEAENALNNGATLDEAAFSGVFSAAAEVITEKIGGISFGGKTLTDTLTDQLAKKATSKIAKFLVGTGKISLNALAEGGEEILSGYASAVGQKMSYMSDKELEELFSNEDALEAFIGGVVLGGLGEVGDIAKSAHDGVSYATGPSKTEQTFHPQLNIDELVDETIAQHTGAPADPVSAAVDAFRQSGTVTNKQATDILNSVKAVQQIVKETGVKLDGLTASGRRAAVKQAVMDYAQKQAVQAEKNADSEESTINVTSAGSAITEQNKAKNTLAYTLASNLDVVRDMAPVSQLTGRELNDQNIKLSDQIRNFFKSLGNKVFRNGLGEVELGEYGVGGVLNHRPINRAKVVSLAAVPDVIQNGRQIGYDPNWKGRGYESYTFAAPVTVNGTPVYVAAVVNKLPNNKFYLSEMVDSNGNYVRIEESPSGNSKNGLPMGPENQQGRDYAGPEELLEGGNPSATNTEPTPRFNNSIPNNSGTVNNKNGAAATQTVDTETQAEYDDENDTITDDETAALLAYKSGGSYQLNAKLRDGIELDGQQQAIVDGLDSALPKLPVYTGTVYRNLVFDDFGGEEARVAFIEGHAVGNVVSYDAYTSASTDANGYPVEGNFAVHMVIESADGKNMAGYGNNFESEVLFARNTYIEINKIEYDTSGTPIIYATEVLYEGQSTETQATDRGGTQGTVSRDYSGKSRSSAEAQTGNMWQMQQAGNEQADMFGISKRNSQGNSNGQEDLRGVRPEVTPADHESVGGQPAQQPIPTKLNIDELVDETIAQHTGAPADPVSAAVDGFRQSGTVTNKQATDILNSVKAVQQIVKETGVKLDGLTSSQKRQAVKTAIEQLAQQKTAVKEHISLEDYVNKESPVWRNVEYTDDATKAAIMQETHEQMVNSGSVVTVSDGVIKDVDQSFPDLRGMKKKERTPILRDALNKLKTNIRQFLSGLANQNFEFEVNGKVLDAKLYSTGINEVMEKVTQEKANMLYSTQEIFRNARYLYSTPDYDGDPNIYRWNYFYTPVQIGEDTVGVRIAVRDMATPQESQIYNWGIKRDASLDGAGRGTEDRISSGVSSDASNNIIRNNSGTVNKKNGAVPSGLDTAPRTDGIPAVDTDLQTEYTYSRSEQVSRIIDRLNNNGENTPTIGEIMALPEIAIAERANEGTKTILLPDREQIQQRAYEAAIQKGSWNGLDYSGEVRQDKRMDIVIGLPGSGKSSVYTERLSMEHKSRVVDTDDFREYIPEYNGINAALVHEEASKMRDRVFASALRGGDNILLSTIGANAEKLADNIRDYKKLGYQVYLHLNELPNNKSLARAIGRYISEDGTLGRYVSPALIADYGDKPTQTYLYLTGQGGNKNGGLESNLRSGRGSSYGNAEETGSRSRTADLLAGYDWYNNDVEKGEAPRLIQSSDKPDSIHEQYRAQVKANAQSANESVGAADKGFSPKYEAIDRYGNIPEGENPARVDQLPRSTNGQDRVSYTARTALEAKVTPDEFAPLIENKTMKGGFSFIPLKNTDVVKEAEAAITKAGWEGARANWTAAVRAGKSSPKLTAIGALLYNNAVNSGDYGAAMDILMDYQLSVRNSAQALQAARILKTLSPSDRLYMIQKSVEQMVEDAHLDTDVTIDEALQEEYRHAETDEARDAVIAKIQQHIADQIPSTLMEKWTALRYVNMLGNFRTQIRNVVGNAGMKAVSSVKNAVATAIENIAHKASGGKFRRTKSLTVSKELLKACRSDFSEVKSIIQGGGKYADSRSETTEFSRGVKDKQTVFKFKPLEGYRKLTNWAMEQGDLVFSRTAYARALAGYLKANGVTGSDLSSVDSSLLDDARLYAVQEAQEQTFRDTNWLSGWISKVGRRTDTPAAVKVLSEGIMPFRKTPANVLVRAEEYSPLGVINSLVTSIKALQKGSDITGAQVVNSWAKSLTGTGIFGLGMLLQSLGWLSAGPDDDEDKDSFDSMNGWQNYALTLPDGTNLTIDFFTPSAIPLLMGAELMQLMQDGSISVRDIESALTSLAEPMVEMSMLQGVNDTLENVRYSENNLGQMVINSALSYLTQGLTNTLVGQLERTFEDSRMTTFVDKDSPLPDWLQRTLGKASAKTPIWEYNQIPYINAWGEEEENPSTGLNAIYNLLSPSYIEKGISTELTQELNRLNSVQSDINVYPSTPDKTVTFDKQSYNLSAEEYVALAKLQGKTQKQLVEDLIAHEGYASLSDENKAKAIRFAYAYARDSARGEVVPDHPGITTKWMAELEGDIAEGILRHVATGTAKKYTDLSIEKASFVAELLDGLLDKPRETKPDGSEYADVRPIQRIEAIVTADKELTEAQQRQVLEDILDVKAFAKYEQVIALGYNNDEYAATYRLYLDTAGGKDEIIRAIMRQHGLSRAAATALYEVYN